jgi:signal transduction histidine kinase
MGPVGHLRAVYSDRTFEIRQPMLAGDTGDTPFGSIRIGVSTVLVRGELQEALGHAAGTVIAALVISSLVAILLAQWMLRPIHVIQSGLSRLGRGELDVTLDLPEHEFRDLGSSFEAVSAQLSAVRAKGLPGAGPTDFESVMENLEDAVALFSPGGELIFCNTTMRGLIGDLTPAEAATALPSAVPSRVQDLAHLQVRGIVERTLAGRRSEGPVSISIVDAPSRLLMSHAIEDTGGRFLGAMLVARNLGYLSHVHSTLNYSKKLAALGRLMAGVAHEVKNPLNAMAIHLELLKQKLARVAESVPAGAVSTPGGAGAASNSGSFRLPPSAEASASRRSLGGVGQAEGAPDLTKHVNIIADEIRRLDQVVGGFLKFARPDELKLQPVQLDTLISDVATTAAPEAERRNVTVKIDCPSSLPEINADPAMLRQALLNLALNACQAMPDGGTLRISCRAAANRRVEIDVEDTGEGIPPENLGRIFDLYFTTKEKGSGIGLSMVFRIVQLHDGEVEVQSTPGRGTRFRLAFPQA